MLTAVRAGADAMAAAAWWRELEQALALAGAELRAGEQPGLHPTRTATVVAPDGEVLGAVGEVDPDVLAAHGISQRVAILELDVERLLAVPHGDAQYRRVSRYPSSDLDLAFVVPDEVPRPRSGRSLADAGGDLLFRLELFDVYRGPGVLDGARSLAYRLRLQAPDRTLTDADTAVVRDACIAAAAQVGAVIRG